MVIYQLQIYYGAVLGGRAIYTVTIAFDNCTEMLKDTINIEPYKQELIKLIEQDGFNPNDFIFDFLTKEQFINAVDSKTRKKIEITPTSINVL